MNFNLKRIVFFSLLLTIIFSSVVYSMMSNTQNQRLQNRIQGIKGPQGVKGDIGSNVAELPVDKEIALTMLKIKSQLTNIKLKDRSMQKINDSLKELDKILKNNILNDLNKLKNSIKKNSNVNSRDKNTADKEIDSIIKIIQSETSVKADKPVSKKINKRNERTRRR